MRSLIEHLGTRDFPRIRVGIGRPEAERDATGHVLAKPGSDQVQVFEQTLDRAAAALESILKDGIDIAMNRFNAEDRDTAAGD
jgi:PTH1 family peptidyl-tRNA hydrolase